METGLGAALFLVPVVPAAVAFLLANRYRDDLVKSARRFLAPLGKLGALCHIQAHHLHHNGSYEGRRVETVAKATQGLLGYGLWGVVMEEQQEKLPFHG